MRSVFKKIVERIVGDLARRVIEKQEPVVIAITGSVGKTSAKDAIHAVLRQKFRARKSHGNLNSELGIPLAVAGFKEGGSSAGFWFKVILRLSSLATSHHEEMEEIMVLEMAVDKPGDMDKLIEIAPPDVGVITNIGVSHLAQFGTKAKILKEKGKLVTMLEADQHAILNGDSPALNKLRKKIKAKVTTYGLDEHNMVRADNISIQTGGFVGGKNKQWGTSFKLVYKENVVPVRLKNSLGNQQVYAALAAASVGIILGMNLIEISEALEKYRPPRGRMNIIEGINGVILIDDTYNASPASTIAALEVLYNTPFKRKIAVLADMLEIGSYERKGHVDVGKAAAVAADAILLFGDSAKIIHEASAEEIKRKKMPKVVRHFESQDVLIAELKRNVHPGDAILIKGSQAMRMERVVKALMLRPEKAEDLLVRQNAFWLKKK